MSKLAEGGVGDVHCEVQMAKRRKMPPNSRGEAIEGEKRAWQKPKMAAESKRPPACQPLTALISRQAYFFSLSAV